MMSKAGLRSTHGPKTKAGPKAVERMIPERILFVHPFTIEFEATAIALGFL